VQDRDYERWVQSVFAQIDGVATAAQIDAAQDRKAGKPSKAHKRPEPAPQRTVKPVTVRKPAPKLATVRVSAGTRKGERAAAGVRNGGRMVRASDGFPVPNDARAMIARNVAETERLERFGAVAHTIRGGRRNWEPF